MQKSSKINIFINVSMMALVGLIYAGAAVAEQSAGSVGELSGKVTAQSASGESRELAVGDKFKVGETIKTGSRSRISMNFADDSRFELGSRAEMTVESFRGGKNVKPEEASFVSKITKGAFRFISGLIARKRPNAMQVRGAVATIGIRGTHVVGEFDETSGTIILVKPEGEPHPTAIDVSNQYGMVTIDEPGYGTEIPDANSPPSPPRRMKERVIRNMMNSLRAAQRISVPRPRM